MALWMVGLNITRQVGVTVADIEKLHKGGPVAQIYGGLLEFFFLIG